jgi:hypothetical protein
MYLIYSICQHSQGPTALSVCVRVVYYMFFVYRMLFKFI